MREPEDGKKRTDLKMIAVIAALVVAFTGVVSTLTFFAGRMSGGTEIRVYIQNSSAADFTAAGYVRAEDPGTGVPGLQTSVRAGSAEPEASAAAQSVTTAGETAASMETSAAAAEETTAARTLTATAADTSAAAAGETSAEETATAAEETTTAGTTTAGTTTAGSSDWTTKAKPQGKVNINTAGAEELQTLPGIGPKKAQSILDYRAEHGSFSSIEDLILVSGIGDATMDKLREWVTT